MNKELIIQMRNIYKYIIINLLLLIIGVPVSAMFLKFGLILLGQFTGWDSYNNHLAFTLISLIGAGIFPVRCKTMQGKSLRRAPDAMADEGVVNLIRRRAHYQNRPESLGYFWHSEIMRSNKLKEIEILAVANVQPATVRA